MSHKSKHKKSYKLDADQEASALKVVCPRCGAWVRKPCIHTTGSKLGQSTSPHPDRIKLANINLSPDTKKKIKRIEEAEPEVEVKSHRTSKDKLDPEQKQIVDTILDKIYALQKHAEFVGPVTKGPLISTYRFKPIHKTRVLHIEGMMKDFAVALGAESLVVKRMPGESAVGVFVPNKDRQLVSFPETLQHVIKYMQEPSKDGHKKIPLNFGITSQGDPFIDDLTTQPHVLIAGSTDSGKSTLMNCFLNSMVWAMKPSELRVLMSDTKKVEFKPYYKDLPHLQGPIAGDQYETMQLFQYLKNETQRRLDEYGRGTTPCRNIHEWNKIHPEHKMPYMVLFIDELADIMGDQIDKTEAKSNASKLGAIVGRSRAAGIYVIAGTQRPSVNVIKGSIKANFPSRVAFRLPSSIDSKTIITTKGAENLMSRGDMFYMSSTRSELMRLHAPLTELSDVQTLVKSILQKAELEKKAALQKAEEDAERIAIQQEGSDHIEQKKVSVQ